jgi:hypothetical protein
MHGDQAFRQDMKDLSSQLVWQGIMSSHSEQGHTKCISFSVMSVTFSVSVFDHFSFTQALIVLIIPAANGIAQLRTNEMKIQLG